MEEDDKDEDRGGGFNGVGAQRRKRLTNPGGPDEVDDDGELCVSPSS